MLSFQLTCSLAEVLVQTSWSRFPPTPFIHSLPINTNDEEPFSLPVPQLFPIFPTFFPQSFNQRQVDLPQRDATSVLLLPLPTFLPIPPLFISLTLWADSLYFFHFIPFIPADLSSQKAEEQFCYIRESANCLRCCCV